MKDYSKANNIENSPFKDKYAEVMNWCLRAFQKIDGMENINIEHWTLADFIEEAKLQIGKYEKGSKKWEEWDTFLINYKGYWTEWYPDVECNFNHKFSNSELYEHSHILEEMARVGYTEDGFEIYVNTDDGGNKPHFHYRKGKYPNYEFHTCIEIKNAVYFHHDGKEGVLTSKQRKDLVKFLKSDCTSKRFNGTNWERVIDDWNRNNSNMEVDEDPEMPNYLNLK